MEYEEILNLQGYLKFFLILIVFIVFYSYVYSMYKRQRTGEKDYEKYSKLVHDDSNTSTPLEDREKSKDSKQGELK